MAPRVFDWRNSLAKELLREDIIAGRTHRDGRPLKPAEVFSLRLEYEASGWELFPSRLYSLRRAIAREQKQAKIDSDAFERDVLIYWNHHNPNPRAKKIWEGSAAQQQLRKDIDDEKHETLTPRKLWGKTTCYQTWSLDEFQDHIYQEVKLRKYYVYRDTKAEEKRKKKMKKANRANSATQM
jgi:hypothetical protein